MIKLLQSAGQLEFPRCWFGGGLILLRRVWHQGGICLNQVGMRSNLSLKGGLNWLEVGFSVQLVTHARSLTDGPLNFKLSSKTLNQNSSLSHRQRKHGTLNTKSICVFSKITVAQNTYVKQAQRLKFASEKKQAPQVLAIIGTLIKVQRLALKIKKKISLPTAAA